MHAIGGVGEGLVELAFAPSAADPDALRLGFGGDVANVLVMAARLGAAARLAGRVGDDGFGTRLVAFWERAGVDASAVGRDPGATTGVYLNERPQGGEHRFSYWRRGSAGSRVTAADLPDPFFDGLATLVVSGITLAISRTAASAAAYAAERVRSAGGRVAFVLNHRPALDPDPDALAAFAAASDVVIGSREDARAIVGDDRPEAVAERLGTRPRELVLSDGGHPAAVVTAAGVTRRAVPPAEVRNAAGAGDALAGAYLAARLRGEPPERALAWGIAASSLSVAGDGCAASYPAADATAALAVRLLREQAPQATAAPR